jgi:mono/diheme cytochrome c family protein
VIAAGAARAGRPGAGRTPAASEEPGVPSSPVTGESWVRHLRLSLENTTLGGTGDWGPAVESSDGPPPGSREALDAPLRLTGKDLYRLSCQSCHKQDGSGAPPEILPVTSLARATSAAYFREKMKERGLPIDEAQLAKNAADAEASLRKRIREGGIKMPPFPHLDRDETESLIAYVKELSGVPPPGPPRPAISESAVRVGELLVKGTCHVCHDAVASPTTEYEYRVGYGNPPPLSFFVQQRTCPQVIRKVRQGLIEPSVAARRGRMPVFDYLTPQEVTAAYLYLLVEPPGSAAATARGAAAPAGVAAGARPRR